MHARVRLPEQPKQQEQQQQQQVAILLLDRIDDRRIAARPPRASYRRLDLRLAEEVGDGVDRVMSRAHATLSLTPAICIGSSSGQLFSPARGKYLEPGARGLYYANFAKLPARALAEQC